MTDLAAEFERRLRAASAEAESLGYPDTAFRGMLDRYPGVELACKLVSTGTIHSGLRKMVNAGRSDLTVEAIMCEPQFEALFDESYRRAAKRRLQDAKAPAQQK